MNVESSAVLVTVRMRGAKQRKAKRRKSREKQARLQRNKVPEPVPESGQRGSAWVPGQCKGRGCELLWTKASEWVIVKGLDAETVASPGMAMAGRKQKKMADKKAQPFGQPLNPSHVMDGCPSNYSTTAFVRLHLPAEATGSTATGLARFAGPQRRRPLYNVAGGTGASEGRGHSALPALQSTTCKPPGQSPTAGWPVGLQR